MSQQPEAASCAEPRRHAIAIDGFAHQNPIPTAARLGPLLVSSMVVGYDQDTSRLPDRPEAQVENVFDYVGAILRAAGAAWAHVVRMTFYVPHLEMRAAINPAWLAHFPDAGSRPARVTHQVPTELGIRCEFIAYVHAPPGALR